MSRRWVSLLVGCLLIASTGIAIGLPAGALADTIYPTCPTFSQFQTDVQSISGTGAVTFIQANCTITADSPIVVADKADVTINGKGLTLLGGTSDSHGTFTLFILGQKTNLAINDATLAYAQDGIDQNQPKDGNIVVTNSTIRDMHTNGISQDDGSTNEGSISLDRSTVRGIGLNGIAQVSGKIDITNSTVSNNITHGIAQITGKIDISNSTISQNGLDGVGQTSGTISLTSSTVTENGYGVVGGDNSRANFQATLLAKNSTQNCYVPTINDKRYNLSDDDSCDFSNTGSMNSVSDSDLNLGTLGDYGGPTQTVPLLHHSVALNAIPTDSSNVCRVGTTVDQRGVPRPQRNKCDIGAYELLVPTVTPQSANASATDASVTLSATVTVSCDPNSTYCPVVDSGKVTFSVTDSNNNPVGVDKTKDKVDNGSASVDFSLSGIPAGTYTITAKYHDGPALFGNDQGTSTLTITPGPATQVTLAPGDTSQTVGNAVTETATVKDQYGNPVADGTTVNFSVTGPNATSSSPTTSNGQASITYTGMLTGQDTVTATAEDGSNPTDSATVTWSAPTSTANSQLTLFNVFPARVSAFVLSGAPGHAPIGSFTYSDHTVTLSHVQLQSLVVNGQQATLFGTAQLVDHTPVTFRLDTTGGLFGGTYRLQVSNGYDSGTQHAMILMVR